LELVKILVSALLIAVISEIAKRSTFAAAILTSLPIASILTFCWVYYETKDGAKVAALSKSIFWLILPSLTLFLCLPALLKWGYSFPVSLFLSSAATVVSYFLFVAILGRFGMAL
jgi:hypothetical protein